MTKAWNRDECFEIDQIARVIRRGNSALPVLGANLTLVIL
jgi:hypothetical protein